MFSFAKKLVDRLEGVNAHEPDTYFKNTLSRNNGYGLRVLNVESDSPASKQGFESWFDYIVGIADHDLPVKQMSHSSHNYLINEDGSFNYGAIPLSEQAQMVDFDMIAQEFASIASSPNPNVNLQVWNAKGGVIRTIKMSLHAISSKDEPKSSLPPATLKLNINFESLGLTVQSQHMNSATFVWKVLNTQQALPAFRALLVPHSDYIIGCDSAFSTDEHVHGLLSMGGENLLTKTISSYYKIHLETLNDDKVPIILYVYNHEYDIVRKVTVHLSRSWCPGGNKGILGCDVGYGLLHRLPIVVGKFDSSLNVLTDELYQNNEDYSYKFLQPQAPKASSAAIFASQPTQATEQAPLPPPMSQPFVPQTVNQSLPPPQNPVLKSLATQAPLPLAQAPLPPTAASAPPPPMATSAPPPPMATSAAPPPTVAQESLPSSLVQAPLPSSNTDALISPLQESNVSPSSEPVTHAEPEPVPAQVPVIDKNVTPFSEQESQDFFATLGEENIEEPVVKSNIEAEEHVIDSAKSTHVQNEDNSKHPTLTEGSSRPQVPTLALLSNTEDDFETIPLTEEPPTQRAPNEILQHPVHAVSQAPIPQMYSSLTAPAGLPEPQTEAVQAPLPSAFNAQASVPQQAPYSPQTSIQAPDSSVVPSQNQSMSAQMSPVVSPAANSMSNVGVPPMGPGAPFASPVNNQAPPFMPPSLGSPLAPPASIRPGRRKRHNPHVNLNALNDIMNEELLKSKESDYQLDPSAAQKEAANLPPPPRF